MHYTEQIANGSPRETCVLHAPLDWRINTYPGLRILPLALHAPMQNFHKKETPSAYKRASF
jgi:hypothetical protein